MVLLKLHYRKLKEDYSNCFEKFRIFDSKVFQRRLWRRSKNLIMKLKFIINQHIFNICKRIPTNWVQIDELSLSQIINASTTRLFLFLILKNHTHPHHHKIKLFVTLLWVEVYIYPEVVLKLYYLLIEQMTLSQSGERLYM